MRPGPGGDFIRRHIIEPMMAVATVIAVSLIIGCSSMMPQAWKSPTPHLPTAQQILAVCEAEKAAGTKQQNAPDCIQYYILSRSCDAAAIGQTVVTVAAPLVSVDPAVGAAVRAGNVVLSLDKQACAAQGFYAAK